ncbi:MAG: squalene/phytoene synthase family protein, partial [Alphaproteobacteria bacterium]|nr:squalene/phytoene synthase family protein [Alphaproteobacteria bacterium]
MAGDEAAYCADQVRRFDHERWLTTLVAPADARRALLALYALNVELARTRESIREPQMGLIRLQWWRDAIAELYDRSPRRHPVVQELDTVAIVERVPIGDVIDLIDARERDLDDAPPDSLAALEDYGAATAGRLAAIALRVLGLYDLPARAAAVTSGTAWALTGLLRAAPQWVAQRR